MRIPSRVFPWTVILVASAALLALLALLWRHTPGDVPMPEVHSPASGGPVRTPEASVRQERDSSAPETPGDPDPGSDESAEALDLGELLRPDGSGDLPLDARTLMGLQVLYRQLPRDDGDDTMAHAAEQLREALPSPAWRTALELLRSYRDYQRERQVRFPQGSEPRGPEAARARLEHLAALRRRHFSEREAEALFGTDEAHSRYYLDAMEIQQDPDLDEQERRQRIEQLRAALPDEASELRRYPEQGRTLRERVEELRARGASEARIQYLREQELGVEAARELREAEERQEEWRRRYRQVREQARPIVDAGLGEADRDEQLEALLRHHYDDAEIPAVRARLKGELFRE